MALYVRMVDSKGPANLKNEGRSWKYYVFILVGLLVLIPVTLLIFNCTVKRIYRSYGNENFDFLLFTQCYPITSCIVGESSMEKCHFAADREAWTIHGIWPSSVGGMGPMYCKRERFNVTEVDSVRNELDVHWYSYEIGGNEEFWKHEWLKHGSCAEQLPALNGTLKYFTQGLQWNQQYNVNDMLEAYGIVPNNTRPYKVEEFQNAIEASIGAKAIIACVHDKKNNVTLIDEIRLCFTKNKDLTSCENLEKLIDCHTHEFIYPDITYLTERS